MISTAQAASRPNFSAVVVEVEACAGVPADNLALDRLQLGLERGDARLVCAHGVVVDFTHAIRRSRVIEW